MIFRTVTNIDVQLIDTTERVISCIRKTPHLDNLFVGHCIGCDIVGELIAKVLCPKLDDVINEQIIGQCIR